ncbi:MAG TPA: aldolase/citrate lyase family protein [Opitutus sp.]|jgi:2-keto-3-deoxy-L-rhamnonate aldolase RhmA|nr:aldolase/citrate lyase family protein [Opitutus sp.]
MSKLEPNRLLANIRAGRVEHCFVLGNHATPRIVDFVSGSGLFETLWFDLEHFDIPTDQLAVLNLVARAHPVTTLARFHADNYQAVQRVLETGIGGIMCAMVESAAEAAQIVRWSKFNNPSPANGETIGQRGWNGGGIDARYGTVPAADYVAHQNRETVILCQIETETGLAAVDEIVAVPGVDGIFFGPGDFAHRIGKLGQIGHADVLRAMERVAASCREHAKFWGTLGIGREHYLAVKKIGAQLICPGGDVRTMNLGLRELAKTFQE